MFRRLRDTAGQVPMTIDGRAFRAVRGESVAAALLAAGVIAFRRTAKGDAPRGPYCGMGVCFDCLVTIDTVPNRQACLVSVTDGMAVETGGRLPDVARPQQT
ncbi:MAG: (2Fe-2S)-binding protein [Beijerinckiaceae bacterium]